MHNNRAIILKDYQGMSYIWNVVKNILKVRNNISTYMPLFVLSKNKKKLIMIQMFNI